MLVGYGMDMGPYQGRGRGPMPMHPAAAAAMSAAGRYPQAPYGYWQYGYPFAPPFPQPFPRMPINGGRAGGRGFVGERRPPPGTPGVSSGLQVSTFCQQCLVLLQIDVLMRAHPQKVRSCIRIMKASQSSNVYTTHDTAA